VRPPLRAVLLDAAGTLIHPRESIGETYARAGRAEGAEIPARRLEDAFRRVFAAAEPMVFPGTPPAEVPDLERAWWRERVRRTFLAADATWRPRDFDALFQSLWDAFSDPASWTPAPGASRALVAFRDAGIATAVVSNFDARLPGILEGLCLAPLLDSIVLPMHVGVCKPQPAIFRAALEALHCTPSEAAYVGDHPEQDIAAARSLGIRAIDATGLATLADLPAKLLEESTE
jgi:putative hydrolase of the HAD superfamily